MEAIWGECGAACAMTMVEGHNELAEIGREESAGWYNEVKSYESLDRRGMV